MNELTWLLRKSVRKELVKMIADDTRVALEARLHEVVGGPVMPEHPPSAVFSAVQNERGWLYEDIELCEIWTAFRNALLKEQGILDE